MDVNLLNYAELATRTEAGDYTLCHERLNPSDSRMGMRLNHAVIGLVTEIGELAEPVGNHFLRGESLDFVNVKEEFGDVLWYIGIASDELDITVKDLMTEYVDGHITDMSWLHIMSGLVVKSSRLADQIKKFIYYGRNLDIDSFIEELGGILLLVVVAASKLGTDVQTLMTENIDKLSKRYPEKFTEDLALKRLDKSEDYLPKLSTCQPEILRFKDVVEHPMKWKIFEPDDTSIQEISTGPIEEFRRWKLDRILNVEAPKNLDDGVYYVMSPSVGSTRRVYGIRILNGKFQVKECLDAILKLQVAEFEGEIPEYHIHVEKLWWDPTEHVFLVSIGS